MQGREAGNNLFLNLSDGSEPVERKSGLSKGQPAQMELGNETEEDEDGHGTKPPRVVPQDPGRSRPAEESETKEESSSARIKNPR